ncbi:MAG: HU family DNA-binding protein [Burkholderiales bacterium]|nr:HU family DNA-binding protein [Burkholderiales bacterium]
MNRKELATSIADKAKLSRKDAEKVLNEIISAITTTLTLKDKLTLIGFGVFSTVNRVARIGRNPKTGEEIKIKETVAPKFKAGKALRESVANSKIKNKTKTTNDKVQTKKSSKKVK